MLESAIKLLCVSPALVPQIWPMVSKMIDAAYAEVDEITPDVRTWLVDGKGLLWIADYDGMIIAALTTSLVMKRSGLVCRMVACGGSQMELWVDFRRQIEEYAKAEGCVKVTAEGRPGWMRALGYRVSKVCVEKEL